MKVYLLTNSNNPNDQVKINFNLILKALKELGHNIITVDDHYEPLQQEGVFEDNSHSAITFKQIISSIRNCDYVIAELTEGTAGVGFEIALALGEKKPVLILYDATKTMSLSTPFRGNTSRYLKLKKYRTGQDIERAIKYFSKDIRSLIETKFILIIPPEIDRYLEWNVREKGVPKAEVTRNAIERIMHEDTRYKSFLDGLEVTD